MLSGSGKFKFTVKVNLKWVIKDDWDFNKLRIRTFKQRMLGEHLDYSENKMP